MNQIGVKPPLRALSNTNSPSVMDVLAYAAVAFLYDREPRRSAERVLARLGRALALDRLVLAPLDLSHPEIGWSAENQARSYILARHSLAAHSRWAKQLGEGSVVVADAGRREADRSEMEKWGAVSMACAPIFVNGQWWGALIAIQESGPRHWPAAHRKLMLAVAGILSAALRIQFEHLRVHEGGENLREAHRRVNSYRTRLDELILASPDAIIIIEPDDVVSHWNRPAKALFGFAWPSRPGRKFADVLPFPLKRVVGDIVGAARTGDAAHAVPLHVDGSGGLRSLLVSAVPLGEPSGTVALIAQDRTEAATVEAKLRSSLETTIHALASALEARDPYTAGHQRRTALLAQAIGQEMGLSDNEVRGIYTAAILHDIGKICVPAEILTCPRRLHPPEIGLIQMHPQAGYEIVKGIEFPWPIARFILEHHEKLDGSGYPKGLKGSDISLGARVICVADVVEAITNHRPYRPALGREAADQELRAGRDTRYDANVVDAYLRVAADRERSRILFAQP